MSPREKNRTPPPNYASRSVQFRLLVAVGSLMLVLTLMFEARKPENWRWMWGGSDGGEVAPATDEDVDTRLVRPVPSGDAPALIYADAGRASLAPLDESTPEGQHEAATRRLRKSAWSQVLDGLSLADRIGLEKVLKAARDRSSLSGDDQRAWAESVVRLEAGWKRFLDETSEAVMLARETMPADQQELWLNVLRGLEVDWSTATLRALRAPADDRPWAAVEYDILAQLQAQLDQLALEAIRDDTVWQPDERASWFRLFEMLLASDDPALAKESTGRVGFLQLFRQPGAYRGKLVTIRGTARLAYHVQAPSNIHGIRGYYVFWVRPQGGPNSPFVVYALEPPPGFPAIKDKDIDRETTPLEEDVEIHGYFFKRWAYRAKDGLHTAPLLLAKRPDWTGAVESSAHALPGPVMIGAACAGLAGLACLLAYLAYSSGSRRSAGAHPSLAQPDRKLLQALQQQDLSPSPQENLRRLAQQESDKAEGS